MSEIGDLLVYRDLKFTTFLKSDDLLKLKSDAKAIEGEIKGLDDQKRSLDSRISALQESRLRLQRFLDVFSDK